MYLRTVKAKGKGGKSHEYLRLVEAYRDNGKAKQRTVVNLGRKDLLEPHLEALIRLLSGEKSTATLRAEGIEAVGAWDWGPVLALRSLWCELGLDGILERLGPKSPAEKTDFVDRAFVLVANRLISPSSEHGLARWLETDYVCDRRGRRWKPEWRDEKERLGSRSPRVRVKSRQLQHWYRTLDQLLELKPRIEVELYQRLRDLFSLEIDVAFYDLTSTYFEGHGPEPLAAHGYSRDNQPRKRQILVGVVLVQGWPLAHHVFRGNERDAGTVREVLKDLKQRFSIRRLVFVGDRGMVTAKNLDMLREEKQGYVVGLNRRRNETVYQYILKATGEWTDCPMGITASEKSPPPRTRVQEVPSDIEGVRVFVVESEERLAYEQAEREKAMTRTAEALEKLRERVAKGRLKSSEKVGAAAARALARYHGHRYYDWKYDDGTFHYFEHPTRLPREKAYEGKYVIQTEEPHLHPVEAVQTYKSLSEVERAFRNLKDVLDLRPIYHQTSSRVKAHVFVAALAFLLQRALERKLKAKGVDLSPPQALQALKTIRVVDIALGNGEIKRSVTRGSVRCGPVLAALGISQKHPPTPPTEDGEAV